MENRKEKEPWYNFMYALFQLRAYLPGPWAVDPPIPPKDREMYFYLARVFEGLDVWISDLEKRLQRLEDDSLVVGWDRIATKAGESKRNLQRKKKKLLQDEIIWEAEIGDPPRKRIVSTRSRLVGYCLDKSRKT